MFSRKIHTNQSSVQRRRSRVQSRSFSTSAVGNVDSGSISRSSTRSNSSASIDTANCGECCGGTTAECAAICCCCPFGIANFLVLAVYKIPAGLCRRALRHKRRVKLQKRGLVRPLNRNGHRGCNGDGNLQIHHVNSVEDLLPVVEAHEETEEVVEELENEMWLRFNSTGFWRSVSQREVESPRITSL